MNSEKFAFMLDKHLFLSSFSPFLHKFRLVPNFPIASFHDYFDKFKNVSEHGECVWLLKEVKREVERVKFESNVKLNIRAFIKEHGDDLKNINSG